jgi:acylphosphatase
MSDSSASNISRLHTVIEGRVQGVGFRYFVLNKAQQLNITGWVRNTAEGDVEVLAEGDRDELEELLLALRKGPRSAVVTNTQEKWDSPLGEFQNFNVRSTF